MYLQRWREGLDQTQCCCCVTDSLPEYCLKIPPAKNYALHCICVINDVCNDKEHALQEQ